MIRRLKRAVVQCGNICEDQVFCFVSLATPAMVKSATGSAIALRESLITGIYGMNFEAMPELSVPYAYFICLGAMAAITATLLIYFYRRGWLAPSEITREG